MEYAEGFKDVPLDSTELVTAEQLQFTLDQKYNSALCYIFSSRVSLSN